jgi:succinate dehydrogenase / fumarate reductase flavoprotein subunit
VDSFHRELGKLLWDKCGMARDKKGLEEALRKIPKLREEFWSNLKILGSADGINMELERAGRVADFLEFGELMCLDALNRNESCGGHFRTEYQTPEGEALRNDEDYAFVSAWKYEGEGTAPTLVKEPLVYEEVKLATRSYK